MTEVITKIWDVAIDLLGFSPALMMPVFALVSLLAWVMKVRERWPEWKDFVLGVLCIVVGCAVAVLGEGESVRQVLRDGVILGSVSAITYQMMKGLLKGLREFIEKKMEIATDLEIDIEEDEVM